MSINKYQPHIFVLPEDDANRQMAVGFILYPGVNSSAIQVLPPAKGWAKVVDQFKTDHVSELHRYPQRMVVLLIDFDDDKDRFRYVESQIPDDLKKRVFILGVQSEPESLKSDIRKTFESIGKALAKDCPGMANELWEHDLLRQNKPELDRMFKEVKTFLFN